MENFALYSKYYDLLYKDKDYKIESDYVVRLLQKYSPSSKSILELGSGTGKHARLFVKEGYQVHGIERSAEMVKIAEREPLPGLSFQVADITSFEKNGERFDTAISLFHVISYLTSNEQLISAFNNIHNHLNENGIFIFDVWHSPAVYQQMPETRIKRISNESSSITRLCEPVMYFDKNVVEINYEILFEDLGSHSIDRIRETHPMRHFSQPEISFIAKYCKFIVLNAEEFLTGNMPGSNTWGVCYILQKSST